MVKNDIMKCIKCDIDLNDSNYTLKSPKQSGMKICDNCYREERRRIMKDWRERNPDKEHKYAKEGYNRNREKELERKKRDYAENRYNLQEKKKDYNLRRDFGIGLDELKKMLADQNYKCKICGKELKIIEGETNDDAAHIDHDHKTGKIRGVLCHYCNLGLSHFFDNPQLLLNAAEYLGVPPVYLSSTGTLRTTTVSHFPTDWVPY